MLEATPGFGVLEGVRVVYSGVEIAAPTAAALMAEWGAEVTWIENTRAGDTIRDTAFAKELERRNQRSISLDIFSEAGREVLFRLVSEADVFLESSKGPAFARRGITDELLWQHNPALVITHISGYGQDGVEDRVNRAAYDLTVQAYSGYLSQNGTPEQPMAAAPYVGDYFTAVFAATATLAALHKATVTGVGESVDVAMAEVMLRVGSYYLMDYLNAGTLYPRGGARHQNLCGIGEYECADGYIGLCVYGVRQNQALLDKIGLGHLWGSEDLPEGTSALWQTNPQAPLIERTLEEYLRARTVAEVEADFSAAKIAANAVLEFPELVADEHLRQRDMFLQWADHQGERVEGLGIVPKFRRHPGRVWRPMPALGGDTEAILRAAGYSDPEIADLIEDGTVRVSKQPG